MDSFGVLSHTAGARVALRPRAASGRGHRTPGPGRLESQVRVQSLRRNRTGDQAMPTSIGTLPVVPLDYTNPGPGLHIGLTQLEAMLNTAHGREGYLVVKVAVTGAVIPIVLARSDLYV